VVLRQIRCACLRRRRHRSLPRAGPRLWWFRLWLLGQEGLQRHRRAVPQVPPWAAAAGNLATLSRLRLLDGLTAKSRKAAWLCQLPYGKGVTSPGLAAASHSRRPSLRRVFPCPRSLPACHRAQRDSQLGSAQSLCTRHLRKSHCNNAAPHQGRCWWDLALASRGTAMPAKLAPRTGDAMW